MPSILNTTLSLTIDTLGVSYYNYCTEITHSALAAWIVYIKVCLFLVGTDTKKNLS